MPPRKSRSTRKPAPPPTAPTKKALSTSILHASFTRYSLPREHLSPSEAEDLSSPSRSPSPSSDTEIHDTSVLKLEDVPRALAALSLRGPPRKFFDKGQKVLGWRHFVLLARTLEENPGSDDEDDFEEDEDVYMPDAADEDLEPQPSRRRNQKKPSPAPAPAASASTGSKGRAKGKARAQSKPNINPEDITSAFSLFLPSQNTSPSSLEEIRISLADLRRISRQLAQHSADGPVDDATLRLMIEEANGERGPASIAKGVGLREFEDVLRRAGVF